ncbi:MULTISPECIES: hypothetical protein [Halobacteriovorax]|uniref:EF-hand domain-containing protein n=1 Tax=Halobacteriovorax vibrionivorans TaxID=2152716 RepID=A0ABY0IDU8_9BACT|nr:MULTISPECIES: hypothetical protein [Halobacteriovorax]RZF21137.1 hypothetical protein DAY19_14250 [Halobacteriovorax vibrionivorans]TGD46266.1 hypothetical protein EP118_12765 [Halobacteriovorax sp. Y22]
MLVLIFLTIFSSHQVFAQGISVIPNNTALGVRLNQVGNVIKKNSCDQFRSKHLNITLTPTCYGANLRHAKSTIDPRGGDIRMNVKLSNGGQHFESNTVFSPQVTWPNTYGQSCTWNAESNDVNCLIKSGNSSRDVKYKCAYKRAKFFLNDALDCRRQGDPLAQAALNSNIKCKFFYNWKGTGYAAKSSYTKKPGLANCGIRGKEAMDVSTEIVSGAQEDTESEIHEGEVNVSIAQLSIPKRVGARDLSTGRVIFSGSSSDVRVEFFQHNEKEDKWVKLDYKGSIGLNDFEDCLNVKAAFLGRNQFCGSYYSPLMLFFDANLPDFLGRSSFPLINDVPVVNWVEPNSKGYFLAIDRNGDGKINSALELFGDQNTYENGFRALAKYDSNNDGVIDINDEVYSNLILWNDLNGNGISESSEMTTLPKKGVTSINLEYKRGHIAFEGRAEAREKSTFTTEDGRIGSVYDIWFSPAI